MRKSAPARVTAVGFIIIIIFGNLWLAHAVTGSMSPEWIEAGFAVGFALAAGGGLGLAGLAVWRAFKGGPTDDVDPEVDAMSGEGGVGDHAAQVAAEARPPADR